MLIMTAKLPRRKLAFSVAAAALVCCAALALNLGGGAFQAASASASGLPSPKGVKSNEDRVAYLEGYGWQVLEEPLATEELLIPEEMDESYDDYLALHGTRSSAARSSPPRWTVFSTGCPCRPGRDGPLSLHIHAAPPGAAFFLPFRPVSLHKKSLKKLYHSPNISGYPPQD